VDNIIGIIVPAIIAGAVSLALAAINKRKTRADLEKIAAEKVAVEVTTLREVLETSGLHIAQLQKKVMEQEAALDAERGLRRKLERKFDMFIALVRKAAPELDLDSILARLEAEL